MDITRRLASATELERLIYQGRFLYAAQPIVSVSHLQTFRQRGASWFDWQIRPQFLPELLSHDVIDAVESLGLGEELDLRVTRDAIDWLAQSASGARVTLSLSSRGLTSSRLFSSLDTWLFDSGVQPGQLCFDIAVHTALRDLSGATRFLKSARKRGARIVLDTPGFVVFCPFASRFPFETWILPKRHSSQFENIPRQGVEELGFVLKATLSKLELALDDPPYNYIIHTAPFDHQELPHYHWHIEIIPRLTKVAGFEWGTGFYINPVPPEDAAAFLREVDGTDAGARRHARERVPSF